MQGTGGDGAGEHRSRLRSALLALEARFGGARRSRPGQAVQPHAGPARKPDERVGGVESHDPMPGRPAAGDPLAPYLVNRDGSARPLL